MKEEQKKPRYGASLKQHIPDFLKMISETTKDGRERAIFFDKDGNELCRAIGTSEYVTHPILVDSPHQIGGIFHTHPGREIIWGLLSYNDFINLLLFEDFEVIGHEYQIVHKTVEKMVPTINLFKVKKNTSAVARKFWGCILSLPGVRRLYEKKLSVRLILRFLDCWTFSKDGEWHYLNEFLSRAIKERKEFYKKAKKTKLDKDSAGSL